MTTSLPERENIVGSVNLYHRHLYICSGQTAWPSEIEQDGGFIQHLAEAIAPHAATMPQKIKLAACDEPSTTPDGYDLLLFPDNLRYIGVMLADIPQLVKTHLVGGQICHNLRHEAIQQSHVFVCTHLARDARCGQCGPELATRFMTELAQRNLSQQVIIRHSSHVGGHRFAGIVLIYPEGVWYGYVTPDDVPAIIDQHLMGGQLVKSLWRGEMGLSPQEQQAKFDILREGIN